MKQIMVLNDGETYTDLDRCMIVTIPDDWDAEQIEEALSHLNNGLTNHIDPIVEREIGNMVTVGDRIRDQLVEANSATIQTVFMDA